MKEFLHDIDRSTDTPDAKLRWGKPGYELASANGYQHIIAPPELFDGEPARFVEAIVRSVQRLEPAATPLHRAVYRILTALADARVRIDGRTLVLALLLAAAKVHNIKIETHPRDLAKEVGVRYATLLKARRAAVAALRAEF